MKRIEKEMISLLMRLLSTQNSTAVVVCKMIEEFGEETFLEFRDRMWFI